MNARTTRAGNPVLGNFMNCLLLGFLSGLLAANFVPAFHSSLVRTWTILGLLLSLLFSMLARHRTKQAERRALDREALERRMERLISKRNLRAHGTHSPAPHGRDEHESTWLPVACRGGAMGTRQTSPFRG